MKTIYLLIGRPRVGKDTLARRIAELTGGTAGACSDIICRELGDRMPWPSPEPYPGTRKPQPPIPDKFHIVSAHIRAGHKYYGHNAKDFPLRDQYLQAWALHETYTNYDKDLRAACAGNDLLKETLRPFLIALGDYLVEDNVTYLVDEAVKSGITVLTGIRRKEELEAAKVKLKAEGWDVKVVWVRRFEFGQTHTDVSSPKDNTTVTQGQADCVLGVEEGWMDTFIKSYSIKDVEQIKEGWRHTYESYKPTDAQKWGLSAEDARKKDGWEKWSRGPNGNIWTKGKMKVFESLTPDLSYTVAEHNTWMPGIYRDFSAAISAFEACPNKLADWWKTFGGPTTKMSERDVESLK